MALPHGFDELPELAARKRIDAGGRLIQNEEFGVVDERAAETKLLFHAAGKFARRAIDEGVETGGPQQSCDAGTALGMPQAEEPAEEVQILEDAELGIEILA